MSYSDRENFELIRELTRSVIALTEEVRKLNNRVKDLEERSMHKRPIGGCGPL